MFSCKTNLQFHSSIDALYVDGTFKSAPKFFHQLLTIHGLRNGHYLPLAFFLLTNKHQTSYEDVFRHTISEVAKLGMNVFIHNAVTTVWPSCEVKACRFHLGHSWWRKIKSFGINKQLLKKVFGLSLLPWYPRETGKTNKNVSERIAESG
jgi:hypothetical protein